MLGNSKRSFGPFLGLDLVFIALALASTMMIIDAGYEESGAIAPVANPLLSGVITLCGVVVLSWIAVLTAKIDQRMNDEFVYRALTNGAAVAVMVAIFAHLIFDVFLLGSIWLGPLTAERLMGILMCAWATGYFVNRVRGTA